MHNKVTTMYDNMKTYTKGTPVLYIPNHAKGNRDHVDVERGYVTSTNASYIFACFDSSGRGQACSPHNIKPV